ncbi:hypothetical protein DFH06DRAFT_1305265 [Mycena polygramma]|nr:hypothetical protein DFH06DRAFT_1305265 [Mycena polygramma]
MPSRAYHASPACLPPCLPWWSVPVPVPRPSFLPSTRTSPRNSEDYPATSKHEASPVTARGSEQRRSSVSAHITHPRREERMEDQPGGGGYPKGGWAMRTARAGRVQDMRGAVAARAKSKRAQCTHVSTTGGARRGGHASRCPDAVYEDSYWAIWGRAAEGAWQRVMRIQDVQQADWATEGVSKGPLTISTSASSSAEFDHLRGTSQCVHIFLRWQDEGCASDTRASGATNGG